MAVETDYRDCRDCRAAQGEAPLLTSILNLSLLPNHRSQDQMSLEIRVEVIQELDITGEQVVEVQEKTVSFTSQIQQAVGTTVET